MKIDTNRIKQYLLEIKKSSSELRQLIDQNELRPNSVPMKAAKYLLIELAEAMSNTIQHILAKDKGIAVSGYIDTIVQGFESGVISQDLFQRLKPFFDFRNSLIHRYWEVDDNRLIKNIVAGKSDFERFIEDIESYLEHGSQQ